MFDNSLFSTFVPELLMLVGYLVCLLTPVFQHHEPIAPADSLELNITNEFERITDTYHSSTYSVSDIDFQQQAAKETLTQWQQILVFYIIITENSHSEQPLYVSGKFCFTLFSRPPPTCLA